jgi:hypothetical protein
VLVQFKVSDSVQMLQYKRNTIYIRENNEENMNQLYSKFDAKSVKQQARTQRSTQKIRKNISYLLGISVFRS